VIKLGQFDSKLLYNDTQPKYKIIAHNPFQIKQILTGKDGPLKLNLLIKQQIIMLKTGQFSTKSTGNRVIMPSSKTANITLAEFHLDR